MTLTPLCVQSLSYIASFAALGFGVRCYQLAIMKRNIFESTLNPPFLPALRLSRAARRSGGTRIVGYGLHGRRILPLRSRVRPLPSPFTPRSTDGLHDRDSERQRVLIAEKKEQLLRMRIRDANLNEGAAEPAHH